MGGREQAGLSVRRVIKGLRIYDGREEEVMGVGVEKGDRYGENEGE